MRIAVVLAMVLLAACGRSGGAVVTLELIDPRRVTDSDTLHRTYLVEVRSAPLTFIDWVLAGLRDDRTDTIPGIRVEFLPAIVGDSVIVGLWTKGAGGGPAGTFTYDLASHSVSRGPLPVWIRDLAQYSEPALSRDAQHLAYVAVTPQGHQYAVVRQWPDGNIVLQGPSGQRRGFRHRGRAAWSGDEVWITYDASVGAEPVMFLFRGNPRDQLKTRVDTFPWNPPRR